MRMCTENDNVCHCKGVRHEKMDTAFVFTVQMYCTQESIQSLLTLVLPKTATHVSSEIGMAGPGFSRLTQLQCSLLNLALHVSKSLCKNDKTKTDCNEKSVLCQFFSFITKQKKQQQKKKKKRL